MLTIDAFIQFFDLCCLGRCKKPTEIPTRSNFEIIGYRETWTRSEPGTNADDDSLQELTDEELISEVREEIRRDQEIAEIDDRISDYSLDWESDWPTPEEPDDQIPDAWIVIIDRFGKEVRVDLRRDT